MNGRIEVQPSEGNTVEIVALKSARAGSPEAAKEMLGRIEIVDSSSGDLIKVETRLPRGGGMFHMGSSEVRYTVKVPAAALAVGSCIAATVTLCIAAAYLLLGASGED